MSYSYFLLFLMAIALVAGLGWISKETMWGILAFGGVAAVVKILSVLEEIAGLIRLSHNDVVAAIARLRERSWTDAV